MKTNKRFTAVCLTLLLLLSILPGAALAANHSVDWAGTYTSEYNNAVTTAPIPYASSQLVKQWDAPVGEGAIAIVDGYIYSYNGVTGGGVTAKGILYKLDKKTGEIVAQLEVGEETGYYYSYAFYAEGYLYVSCPKVIMCFDIDSFTLKWKTYRTEIAHCSAQYVNGYIVANGLIFDAATGAQLMDGNKALSLEGSYDWANGAEVGGYFYIASSNTLYAYNTSTWAKSDELEFKGGRGSGAIYHNGRIFWAAGTNVFSVKVSDGAIDDDSMVTYKWDYTVTATPVALDSRVYFVGTQVVDTSMNTGYGAIGVFNAADLSLQYIALLDGTGHKLQTAPILRSVTSGGAEIASIGITDAPAASTAYVYVQDYKNPSSVYVLCDTVGQTSGTPEKLFTIEPEQYAFEQMAFDKQGALYCSNDSGYLVKYAKPEASVPTFSKNLSTEEVFFDLGAQVGREERLSVQVTKKGEGTISYQWQFHNGDGVWKNITGAAATSYTPSTSAAGTVYYRCVAINTNGSTSARAYSNIAKITVQSSRGDVNGDGVITNDDAACLRQYLAGKSVTVYKADINGDGAVDLADLIILRRHLGLGEPFPEINS